MAAQIYEFVDEGLGHMSYVIDLGDHTAAVVDPPRFPIAHETLIDRLGLRLAFTMDTHSHADYVTGSSVLATRVGATFIAPGASRLMTPHRPVHDNERVSLSSRVDLVAHATPGHTPDHYAYLITDNGVPMALFSGGSLMVGTVGRTDLCGPTLTGPLAHEMFQSLHRFHELPAELAVYPTHGAGSFCSAPGASERTSTLAIERRTNPLLSIADEDEFVRELVAGFGTFPTYFSRLPEVNRRGPKRYDALPQLALLSADEVDTHRSGGGIVVDVRSTAAFADSHIPGSLSIALRPVLGSWLGWLVGGERKVAFVLDEKQDSAELVRLCLDIGHEGLLGQLAGGIESWVSSARPVASIPLVGAEAMTTQVVDVRQVNEFVTGHVPGAINIELGSIATADLPAGILTVMCGHGERAMSAASLVAARGRADVAVFYGGPDTWSAATGTPLAIGR